MSLDVLEITAIITAICAVITLVVLMLRRKGNDSGGVNVVQSSGKSSSGDQKQNVKVTR